LSLWKVALQGARTLNRRIVLRANHDHQVLNPRGQSALQTERIWTASWNYVSTRASTCHWSGDSGCHSNADYI